MSVGQMVNDHIRSDASHSRGSVSESSSHSCRACLRQLIRPVSVMTMKHRPALTLAGCLMSLLVTVFAASSTFAQGVRPFDHTTRGGVRPFDSNSAGVRRTAPGVREYGDERHSAGLAYFGIMGAVSPRHAGTYSSPQGSVELSQLVQSAQGLSDNATGMAQIIRNGRIAMRVFLNANITHQLLPGDLVILQRDRRQEQAAPGQGNGVRVASGTVMNQPARSDDRVEVAFVGILENRPIIVPLDKKYATVTDVIDAMQQHPALAETVRLIRTDIRAGLPEPGSRPEHLADGDVLVFDASFLNFAGLAQAQQFPETQFPEAIPMAVGQPTSLQPNTNAHTTGMETFEPAFAAPGPEIQTSPEPSQTAAPIVEPVRAFEATPLPSPSLDFPSADAAPSIPFAPMVGTVDDHVEKESSVHQTSYDYQIASEETLFPEIDPVPQIEVPELSAASHSIEPALVNTLFEPSSVTPQAEPEASSTAYYESDRDADLVTQTHGLVPVPKDPELTSLGDDKLAQMRSLSTASIALAVLVLAAMCFVVSVIWSRIDRTAQSLQQDLPLPDVPNQADQSRTLDRLIENNLPIIEERAPLLQQSDYQGKEVGKRRLMIDQLHSLAGPHFSVNASVEQESAGSRPKVRRRSNLEASQGVESRLDRAVEHVRTFRSDEQADTHDAVTEQDTTSDVPQRKDEPRSDAGLLDRVLVAMERERRR